MPIAGIRHRPTLGRASTLVATLVAAGSCGGLFEAVRPRTPRHLVVVCIDTLRADRVGAYGHDRPTTPNLDRLARDGARFTTAYAHSSWTVPATASLLTAMLPSRHGAGLEGAVRQLGNESQVLQIRAGVDTLQARLGRHGFATGLFSANPYLYGNFQKGFGHAEVAWRSAEEVTDSALRWIEERPTGGRLFAYLQLMDLHHPIEPPPRFANLFPVAEGGRRGEEHEAWSFAGLSTADELEDPAFLRFRAHKLALYDGALRYVDEQLGRLVRRLQELEMAEDTLLVITADHGEEFWDHALEQAAMGGDPRGIWGVGHGHTLFEELLRVPLVLSGPGVPEREDSCPARHVDVLPTVLELLGLPAAAGVDGASLVARLAAGDESCPSTPVVAESLAYGPESRAIVWRGRKLIERSDGVTLLFDLRSDPGERRDLAASQPHLVAGMRALLHDQLAGAADAPRSEAMVLDAETERQLRALGYLD